MACPSFWEGPVDISRLQPDSAWVVGCIVLLQTPRFTFHTQGYSFGLWRKIIKKQNCVSSESRHLLKYLESITFQMTKLLLSSQWKILMQPKTQLLYITDTSAPSAGVSLQTGLPDLIFTFGVFYRFLLLYLTLTHSPWFSCFSLTHTETGHGAGSPTVSMLIPDSFCSLSSSLKCQNTFPLIFAEPAYLKTFLYQGLLL